MPPFAVSNEHITGWSPVDFRSQTCGSTSIRLQVRLTRFQIRRTAFISIGTSAAVYPAAGFIHAALARGARTVEINRDHTQISAIVDWSLRGKSGEILPRLVETLP